MLPVDSDNTHCAFIPSCLGHYFILIALTLLTREPLQRGIKLRTMWRCLFCRCFSVTLTADPHLSFVRAVRAPACRHRSRQPPPLRLKMITGSARPILASAARTPRPSSLLASFHPQGSCAGNSLLAALVKPGRRLQVLFSLVTSCRPHKAASPGGRERGFPPRTPPTRRPGCAASNL